MLKNQLYQTLKNPTIGLVESILTQKPEFCQTWGLVGNTNSNMIFPFRLFPEKSNDFSNNAKNTILDNFLPFSPEIIPTRIFSKNRAPSVLALIKSNIHAKNQKE